MTTSPRIRLSQRLALLAFIGGGCVPITSPFIEDAEVTQAEAGSDADAAITDAAIEDAPTTDAAREDAGGPRVCGTRAFWCEGVAPSSQQPLIPGTGCCCEWGLEPSADDSCR